MDDDAESAPLVSSRAQHEASGPAAASTAAHMAPNPAAARAGTAAEPGAARAVFELEEDESAALVGGDRRPAAAQRVPNRPDAQESMPLWVIPLLVAAVFAVSSAGAVFKLMGKVPPLSLAAWRLQLTTLLLLPGCIINFRSLSPELQHRTLRSYGALLISGTSLALHFGCWVWGIEHTSLIHAYLCVATTPIIIAGGTWILRRPISRGELGGTALGAVGTVLLTLGPAAKESQVTLVGDLVTLCAAVTVIGYFEMGQRLRAWMPIFLYACPATGIAAFLLTIGAIAFEGARFSKLGIGGVLGWLSKDYLLGISYLALVPGIVGHTGLNTVLKYMSPLLITLSTTTEPLIGACIGYFILGIMSAPNAFIYIGGGIILVATCWVTVAQNSRKTEAAARARLSETFGKVSSDELAVEEESAV